MSKKQRFLAIVTPARRRRYRVFDRITKQSWAATEDRALAQSLAREFSESYPVPWYRRFYAWISRSPLPGPPIEQSAEEEPEPEWKQRFARVNEICNERTRQRRIANGGRIVENDSIH